MAFNVINTFSSHMSKGTRPLGQKCIFVRDCWSQWLVSALPRNQRAAGGWDAGGYGANRLKKADCPVPTTALCVPFTT
uniref:Uncharacterized protein n=1 Tax=Panagrellus redivivus TaxID=6233 RepID=A0A7E4UMR1_PANRE